MVFRRLFAALVIIGCFSVPASADSYIGLDQLATQYEYKFGFDAKPKKGDLERWEAKVYGKWVKETVLVVEVTHQVPTDFAIYPGDYYVLKVRLPHFGMSSFFFATKGNEWLTTLRQDDKIFVAGKLIRIFLGSPYVVGTSCVKLKPDHPPALDIPSSAADSTPGSKRPSETATPVPTPRPTSSGLESEQSPSSSSQ